MANGRYVTATEQLTMGELEASGEPRDPHDQLYEQLLVDAYRRGVDAGRSLERCEAARREEYTVVEVSGSEAEVRADFDVTALEKTIVHSSPTVPAPKGSYNPRDDYFTRAGKTYRPLPHDGYTHDAATIARVREETREASYGNGVASALEVVRDFLQTGHLELHRLGVPESHTLFPNIRSLGGEIRRGYEQLRFERDAGKARVSPR